MGKMKQMMEDKSELALMGKFVTVENEDEVRFITNYILTVLGKSDEFKDFDIYSEIHRYPDEDGNNNTVTNVGTCRVEGMACIVYCLKNLEVPDPFEEDYGSGYPAAFCYVFNTVAHDMCSEFGDCFFEKRADNYYHRIS